MCWHIHWRIFKLKLKQIKEQHTPQYVFHFANQSSLEYIFMMPYPTQQNKVVVLKRIWDASYLRSNKHNKPKCSNQSQQSNTLLVQPQQRVNCAYLLQSPLGRSLARNRGPPTLTPTLLAVLAVRQSRVFTAACLMMSFPLPVPN